MDLKGWVCLLSHNVSRRGWDSFSTLQPPKKPKTFVVYSIIKSYKKVT